MADQLVATTIRFLLEKAVSIAADRISLALGFYKDLEDLKSHAEEIQAVLADAETKQSQNPIVLRWLKKVEGVALEASYVLDELLYESLRRQVKSRNKSKGVKVCLFFSLSKHDISFRLRMGSKVRDINAKLKNFNLEATASVGLIRAVESLVPGNAVATAVQVAKNRQTDSLALKFIAGRTNEISDIVERLLMHSSDELVSVLPIIGMGGLGKTTVAKSVYNDEKINVQFRKKSWFCMSEHFEVTEVLRGILESLKGVKVDPCGRDALVQQIQKEFNKERFLVVLDDVWDVDKILWGDFYDSLAAINAATGSCCVVTTRLQTTANLVCTVAPFVLEKLLDDDCWSILTQKATKGGDIPDELEVHKKQILRRCQGLPLAANAIGSLLSMQSRDKWLSIVENQVLKVNEVVDEITPILRLSFDNLPSPSIKKCFAYCSIYEKDAEIDGKELVELWMAEGFLQDDVERGTTMEQVGSNYLMILLQSSLLEETIELLGKYYQMHDIVHDMAESISKAKLFDVEKNYHVQHLRLDTKYSNWNARSPLVGIEKGGISAELLSKFKYLHVLNLIGDLKLNDAEIANLAPSISKLKHLRSLTIGVMPEALCKLYNLQTLRLKGYQTRHPQGLSNLISLRHLYLNYFDKKEFQMAPEMGRLTRLRNLETFNVKKEKGYGIEELGSMNSLEGSIEIHNLELVKDKEGALLANLHEKNNLKKLVLCWDRPSHHENDHGSDDEHVLEGLEPHPNLQKLVIKYFMGVRFPLWLGKLSSLVHLKLRGCVKCTCLPAFGRFPYLESLKIKELDNVACIGDSYYNDDDCKEGKLFPSLKHLELESMTNLTEWKELQVEAMNDIFPSLNRVTIRRVNVSVVKDIIGRSASLLIKDLTLSFISGMSSVSDVIPNHLHLTSLETFRVNYCEELTDIPSSTLEGCTSLRELFVCSCPNLVSFPLDFQYTPSLTLISFDRCPEMFTSANAMPRGFSHLTSLQILTIGPLSDDSVQLFDWSGLTGSSTLKNLYLTGRKLTIVPQQIQYITSLVELELLNFASVQTLSDWLGNLTSLKTLSLWGFPQLEYLPSASAMASLTNLRTLWINECPLLKQSWDRKGNDPCSEWSKISGLPNLRVLM